MFSKLFKALTSIATAAEAFAASIKQADERFRSHLALDHAEAPQDVPALEDRSEPEKPSRNGHKAKAAAR